MTIDADMNQEASNTKPGASEPEPPLQAQLDGHAEWVRSDGRSGAQADLSRLDLRGLDLRHRALRGANLTLCDLREADLSYADLSGATLEGTDLRGALIRYASLDGVKLLLPSQLAGADLTGAQLDDRIEFSGIDFVNETARQARATFLTTALALLYCLLTIAATNDVDLVVNRSSFSLPIVATKVPVVSFYWFAPLLLCALHVFFHVSVQRLWSVTASLPAIMQDGRRLDHVLFPGVLLGILSANMRRLRFGRPLMSPIDSALAFLILWFATPTIMVLCWWRFLPRQDLAGLLWIIALTTMAVAIGRASYQLMQTALRTFDQKHYAARQPEAGSLQKWCKIVFSRFRPIGAGIFATIFIGLTLAIVHGETFRHLRTSDNEIAPWWRESATSWLPEALTAMGFFPYADLWEGELAQKPDKWVPGLVGDDLAKALSLVRTIDLRDQDLSSVIANRAFLAASDLRNADLRIARLDSAQMQGALLCGSDLYAADLRSVWLQNSGLEAAHLVDAYFDFGNLDRANLSGADASRTSFEHANLHRADMRSASFTNAKFSNADLSGVYASESIFDGADFTEANLSGGVFSGASFRGSDLTNVNLEGAVFSATLYYDSTGQKLVGKSVTDFSGANLSFARNLTMAQVRETCGDSQTRLPEGIELQTCTSAREAPWSGLSETSRSFCSGRR